MEAIGIQVDRVHQVVRRVVRRVVHGHLLVYQSAAKLFVGRSVAMPFMGRLVLA